MNIKNKLGHYSWELAYGELSANSFPMNFDTKNMKVIKNPYNNKWFADPFILKNSNSHLDLLVEEFDYNVNYGRIAKIVVDKTSNTIIDYKIILDIKTHCSFPSIYRCNDTIYVHPENSASGKSYIYKYDQKREYLIEPSLMIEEPITDAIIKKINNEYYMFATKLPNPNGNYMHIYKSSNFIGGYKEINHIKFDNNRARMGGYFIEKDNTSYRICQDCNGDYGKGLFLEKFLNLESFFGQPIKHITTHKLSKYEGIHTLNTFENMYVIDLKKYDYPITHKLIRLVKKTIGK